MVNSWNTNVSFQRATKFVMKYDDLNERRLAELTELLTQVEETNSLPPLLSQKLADVYDISRPPLALSEQVRDLVATHVMPRIHRQAYAADCDLVRALLRHPPRAVPAGWYDPVMVGWLDSLTRLSVSDDPAVGSSQQQQNIWTYGVWHPLYTLLERQGNLSLAVLGTTWRVIQKFGTYRAELDVAERLMRNPTLPLCFWKAVTDVAGDRNAKESPSEAHIRHTQQQHPELAGLPHDLVVEVASSLPSPVEWHTHVGFSPAMMEWPVMEEEGAPVGQVL